MTSYNDVTFVTGVSPSEKMRITVVAIWDWNDGTSYKLDVRTASGAAGIAQTDGTVTVATQLQPQPAVWNRQQSQFTVLHQQFY